MKKKKGILKSLQPTPGILVQKMKKTILPLQTIKTMQKLIMNETDTVANYFTQRLLEDERVSFASYKRCHFLEKKQTCEIVADTEEHIAIVIEDTKLKLLAEITDLENEFIQKSQIVK